MVNKFFFAEFLDNGITCICLKVLFFTNKVTISRAASKDIGCLVICLNITSSGSGSEYRFILSVHQVNSIFKLFHPSHWTNLIMCPSNSSFQPFSLNLIISSFRRLTTFKWRLKNKTWGWRPYHLIQFNLSTGPVLYHALFFSFFWYSNIVSFCLCPICNADIAIQISQYL